MEEGAEMGFYFRGSGQYRKELGEPFSVELLRDALLVEVQDCEGDAKGLRFHGADCVEGLPKGGCSDGVCGDLFEFLIDFSLEEIEGSCFVFWVVVDVAGEVWAEPEFAAKAEDPAESPFGGGIGGVGMVADEAMERVGVVGSLPERDQDFLPYLGDEDVEFVVCKNGTKLLRVGGHSGGVGGHGCFQWLRLA